jgi:hypothetical protein
VLGACLLTRVRVLPIFVLPNVGVTYVIATVCVLKHVEMSFENYCVLMFEDLLGQNCCAIDFTFHLKC